MSGSKGAPSRARDGSDIVSVVVGTAGHIDHGKSTLVRTLTGMDMDRLKDEKRLEGTVDLNFARFDLADGRTVGVVDVPGHERFVKNMVAGASGVDVVLLVVAANDGIMPQTREHLDILTLLGIEQGIVVITKIDLVDEELLEVVKLEVQELVQGTFLEKAPVCPLSSTTRAGFDAFKAELERTIGRVRPKDAAGAFRMPIQRVFSSRGHGTVLTGIPVSGRVAVGDAVEVLPRGMRGRVRGIQAYQREVDVARAGHSSALNVADVDWKAVERGHVVCAPGLFAAEKMLEAKLTHIGRHRRPLKDRTTLRVHLGTAEILGEVVLLEGEKTLPPGATALCQLRLEEPLVAAPGDRFIARLHSPLETVGGGVIIGASKHRLKAGKAFVIERLERKEAALDDKDGGVVVALEEAWPKPLKADAVSREARRPRVEVDAALERLLAAKEVVEVSGGKGNAAFTVRARFDEACRTALETIGKQHERRPLRSVVPRAELKQALPSIDELVLEAALAALEAEGKVARTREGVRDAAHEVRLSEEEQGLAAELERIFLERGFATPTRDEALGLAGGLAADDAGRARAVFDHLLERGDLVQVSEDVIFHRERYEEAKRRVREGIERDGLLLASAFKDELGTSRKYVIPLLEHFDDVGLTSREGDGRVLRKPR